jgi:1,2-diacylglycerol 3-beta-galactosyltransferase
MKLPVIVELNARTLPQERYNAEWILEKQVGVVVPNFRSIDTTVEQLLVADTFARYRANAAAVNNHAVFEIPDTLERILRIAQKNFK